MLAHLCDNGGMDTALALLTQGVEACVETRIWALTPTQRVAALDAIVAAEKRLASVKLALIRQVDVDGTAVASGASSTGAWLADRLRMPVPAARALVGQAAALDAAPQPLREALAAGAVSVEQAKVIADAVAALPASLGPQIVTQAATSLIGSAAQFDPITLRRLGQRVLDTIAPQIAEEADRKALEREERRAYQNRYLTITAAGDGGSRLFGYLDAEGTAIVRAVLDPLTMPRQGDERTAGQRRADALVEALNLALHTGQLPEHGGDRPQLVVTVAMEPLTKALAAGQLDSGERLTPEAVRRLACDAQILPAVLGGKGQPLDLGRQRRLVNGALRRALVIRDRGCAFPGCERPARWCEGHHVIHWNRGGRTQPGNCVLLCRHHHRVIHQGGWQVYIDNTDALPTFIPPTWVDPLQRPRRNKYHRRQ